MSSTGITSRHREDFDDLDEAILLQRVARRSAFKGPRVGDFCILKNGDVRRFAHDWGDTIQPSSATGEGSYHLNEFGQLEHSGGLEPGLPKSTFREVPGLREGRCWWFSHNIRRGGNGVTALIPCRVYEEVV